MRPSLRLLLTALLPAALFAAGEPIAVTIRVDATHSNCHTLWRSFGSPVAPTKPQYQQLEAAAQLALLENQPATLAVVGGAATLKFSLPRQGVSLLVFEW